MRSLNGMGGGRGSALAGIGLAAERLKLLGRERPARFSERTDRDREQEIAREIAREAAAIKKEEESMVRAGLLVLLVLNGVPDHWNVCRYRVKRFRRLEENGLRVEVG